LLSLLARAAFAYLSQCEPQGHFFMSGRPGITRILAAIEESKVEVLAGQLQLEKLVKDVSLKVDDVLAKLEGETPSLEDLNKKAD